MKTLVKTPINFTMSPNDFLNNSKLSRKAKGLLIYLYSKPNDRDFAISRIKKDGQQGYTAIKNGIEELEENGYLIRKKKGNGRMLYFMGYNPDKVKKTYDNYFGEKANSGKPQLGKTPTWENHDHKKEREKRKKEKEEKNNNIYHKGKAFNNKKNEDKSYGNKKINKLLKIVKKEIEETNKLYSPGKSERKRATNWLTAKNVMNIKISKILKQFKLENNADGRIELARTLIELSNKFKYVSKVNNFQDFYYKRPKIYNQLKDQHEQKQKINKQEVADYSEYT